MTQRIPLDHLTHDQLDALYDRLDLLQRGAAERSALLEEARDALEAAGITDAHGGESWPRLVPAIEHLAKQAARTEQVEATLDRVRALADRYEMWHEGGWAPASAALVANEFRAALDEQQPTT